MPQLRVRWSEHEAGKPYARPFMVSFFDDAGAAAGSVAVSGSDLLYYRQFQTAVMALSGELFSDPDVDSAADPQRVWLDRIAALLPEVHALSVVPVSAFDDHHGRVFRFDVRCGDGRGATVDALSLLEYQEFQAVVAHQTGRLFRQSAVEGVEEPRQRQAAWISALRDLVSRPDPAEAMTESWPWR